LNAFCHLRDVLYFGKEPPAPAREDSLVKVKTTRFGEIEVDEASIIKMCRDILGFEGLKLFTIIAPEDKTPFMWLQSLEEGNVAFVVVNPRLIKPDYQPEITDADIQTLSMEKSADVMLLTIVTIYSQPLSVTINLRAPIVINKMLKIARQIVLDDSSYAIKYHLIECKNID
jgi:flagellar assembly factor FliW